MKFTNLAKLSALVLCSQQALASDCSYVGGNYYCSETDAVVYQNVGYAGSYKDVTNMDESSGKCSQSSTSFSGSNAPLDEELSVHFRGPIKLLQFGVYSQSSTSSKKKKRADTGHSHNNLEERGLVVDVVEVYSTVYVNHKGETVTSTDVTSTSESTVASTSDAVVAAATTSITPEAVSSSSSSSAVEFETTTLSSTSAETPLTISSDAIFTSSTSVAAASSTEEAASSTTEAATSTTEAAAPTTEAASSTTEAVSSTTEAASSTTEAAAPTTEESSSYSPVAAYVTTSSSSSSSEKVISSSTSSATVTSSSSASSTSSTTSSSSGGWSRGSYYSAGSSADNVVFMNYYGGSGSGVWSSTFGNSISYANSDCSGGSSSSVALGEVTVPSNNEFMIFSGESCSSSSGCGYYRKNIPAYHGFGGATKMFVFEFEMPTDTSGSYNQDMPAIWMLNAKIPRTLQYGNSACSCWSTGCGELDLFEILSAGSNKLITHIHDGQGNDGSSYGGGGTQDYFARPTSGSMKAAVIFNGADGSIHIVKLDSSVTFDSSLDASLVEKWLNTAGSTASLS